MPGLITMNEHGEAGTVSLKDPQRRSGDAVQPEGPGKPLINGGQGNLPQLDGPVESRNGHMANGLQTEAAGRADAVALATQEPPEIRHVTEGFQPFSKLLTRTAQECHNDLLDLINNLADIEMPAHDPPPAVNGLGVHAMQNGAVNASPQSAQKRKMVLEWADMHRKRFIKLLVLSQWSRQAAQVSKLIDILNWAREQDQAYNDAAFWVGAQKANSDGWKVRNPDIKTALEVLSTGKVSWLPEYGYIPQEPLSPDRMLKLLRATNTILSLKLNLHEDLPPHLRNWTIKDGRATFVVPGEFELDVFCSDEKPESPFFFMDMRFLFTPAPEIPDGAFRATIEAESNRILGETGLSGCFDFLHNFVLTAKVAALRDQAYRMASGHWTGAIRVEPVHRILTIQYWTEKVGPKSWIEIGVNSGKSTPAEALWDGPAPSFLSVRWIRSGTVVNGAKIKFDWAKLSVEKMLKRVISAHIRHNLELVHGRLKALAQLHPSLSARLRTSASEPTACKLKVSLGPPSNSAEVLVEHITGRMVVRPPGPGSAAVEHELNSGRVPLEQTALSLTRLLAMNLKQGIDKEADLFGWERPRNLDVKLDSVKFATKKDVISHSFYRGVNWPSAWVMLAVIDLSGESWWVLELSRTAGAVSIASVIPIKLEDAQLRSKPVDRERLRLLGKAAVRLISYHATERTLQRMGVESRAAITRGANASAAGDVLGSPPSATLIIRFSQLMAKAEPGRRQPKAKWAAEALRLTEHGYNERTGNVQFMVRGNMGNPDRVPLHFVSSARESDVRLGRDGVFTILLRSPLGTPCVPRLMARLVAISRLRSFSEAIKAESLRIVRLDLGRITFGYAKDLYCTFRFPQSPSPSDSEPPPTAAAADDGQVDVHFHPPSNPHHRTRTFLAALLNDPHPAACTAFIRTLRLTLPVLVAFDALESLALASTTKPDPDTAKTTTTTFLGPTIHPRHATSFRLSYPLPRCSFDVRLRPLRASHVWHVDDTATHKDDAKPLGERPPFARDPRLAAALAKVFVASGEGFDGVRHGFVAHGGGVREALRRLDECVRGVAAEVVAGGGASGAESGSGGASGGARGDAGRAKGGAAGKEVITLD